MKHHCLGSSDAALTCLLLLLFLRILLQCWPITLPCLQALRVILQCRLVAPVLLIRQAVIVQAQRGGAPGMLAELRARGDVALLEVALRLDSDLRGHLHPRTHFNHAMPGWWAGAPACRPRQELSHAGKGPHGHSIQC